MRDGGSVRYADVHVRIPVLCGGHFGPGGPLVLRVGDTVTVRAADVDHHHRTPWFVKGKAGTVRLVHGVFRNPESRAHGGDGLPRRRLCQVEFHQSDVWGKRYRGPGTDVILIDVFEHWLERA